MKNNLTLKVLGVLFLLLALFAGRAEAVGVFLFEPYTTFPVTTPNAVGVGDFNHDGLNDVALANFTGVGFDCEVQIFLQNVDGGLDSAVSYPAGTRAESLAVGDLNNDGWDDVVVTNFNSNTVSVFLQQADGAMAARVTYTTGSGPDAVAVGDVNRDGLDDVAVANWNSAFISVFLQNVGGTLNAKVDYASPLGGYDDIVIGDVNGDGLNDVIKMNGQLLNPDLQVFTQSEAGTLNNAVFYDLPENNIGHGIGVGDVTGDGKADVVMSYGGNTPTAFIAVFAQAVNGTLQSPVSYTAYDVPEAVEVTDVNSDGHADVIVAHGGWDAISVYLQQNNGSLGSYSLYGLPQFSASHYKPQALAIGDINTDFLPDVLIANYNFGLNVLYHVAPDIIPPIVDSIALVSPNPTNANSVRFTVTFSEPVNGVNLADFTLTASGVSNAALIGISGTGALYTVTVSTGTGGGALRLDVTDDDTILDDAFNPLGGSGVGNGDFTGGDSYTLDANRIPTNIQLSNSNVAENLPIGTTVGTLTTTDPDVGDTHTYSFCARTDNSSFQIGGASNNELQTAAIFDYETKNSYNICIRTDDGNGGTFDKAFTIAVIDIPGFELISPANGATLSYNRPTFDWSNYPGAIGYTIQVSKNTSFSSLSLIVNVSISGGSNSQYTSTKDLTANSTLYWRVRAKLSGTTYSAWSTVYTLHTANPPRVPVLASPANGALVSSPSPLFNWNNSKVSAGVIFDHYQFQIATDSTFTNIVHDVNLSGVTNSQDGSAVLNSATTYYWRVRAFAADGDYSSWSTVWSVKIKYDPPTLLTPTNGATSVALKPNFAWSATLGATGYTIQVSKSSTFGTYAINANVTVNSFTPGTNLNAHTLYHWRVKVNGPFGPSNWSLVFSFTTQ